MKWIIKTTTITAGAIILLGALDHTAVNALMRQGKATEDFEDGRLVIRVTEDCTYTSIDGSVTVYLMKGFYLEEDLRA